MSSDSFLPVWYWQHDQWRELPQVPGHLGLDVDVWLRQLDERLGPVYVFWQHRRGSVHSLAQHPREEDYVQGTQRPAMWYWPLWTQVQDPTYPTHPRFFAAGRTPPKAIRNSRRLIDHVHVHAGAVRFFAMSWKDVLRWLELAGVARAECETIAYQYYGMSAVVAGAARLPPPLTDRSVGGIHPTAVWIEETWGDGWDWQQYLAAHPTCWGGIYRRSARCLDWVHRRHDAIPRVTQLGDWVYWARSLDDRFPRWMLWQDSRGTAVEVWGWDAGGSVTRWRRLLVQETPTYTRCVGIEGWVDDFTRQWRWWWGEQVLRPVWTPQTMSGAGADHVMDTLGEWQTRYSLHVVPRSEWLQVPAGVSWPEVARQWVWWKRGEDDRRWRTHMHWDMSRTYEPPAWIASTDRWLMVPAQFAAGDEDEEEERLQTRWYSRVAGYPDLVHITWQVHAVVIDIVPGAAGEAG